MKVVFVNHSDVRGGASVVTVRLVQVLRYAGIDARMVVGRIEGDPHPLWLSELHPQWRRKAAFLGEHLEIFLRNGFSRENLFKASIATMGMPVHSHPWVQEADIVVLAWVNQGLISLKEIERLHTQGKRIVMAMHDMWSMTGVCHHAGECNHFLHSCGHCPLMHSGTSANDLSHSALLRKKRLYSAVPITFVAVSNWLADKAKESSLLSAVDVRVIPNVFPIAEYGITPTTESPFTDIPADTPLVVMGAARLDDPIKGLPLAIEALNKLNSASVKAHAVFFGTLRNPDALKELQLTYTHLGTVADKRLLADLYARASVVISSSLYETLPGTVIEGMAAGATAVTFDRGGQTDIIRHGQTGYIVPFGDTDAMSRAIASAIQNPFDRQNQHNAIHRLFGPETIVDKWREIFKI